MQTTGFVRITVAATLALLATGSLHGATVTAIPIGTPAWVPVDFNLFSASIGTAATGYVEFSQTTERILAPPNHQPHPDLGVGPGAAHLPPYDTELSAGVQALGYVDKSVFSPAEFSGGLGVYLAFMVVPATTGSATGSSPDFTNGPIIPNTLFPIHVELENRRGGLQFSQSTVFDVPALDAIDPPFAVGGHSHFPIFLADNFDFALDPTIGIVGSYQFGVRLTDVNNEGWDISTSFQVVPEPATSALFALGTATLAIVRRRTRS